MLKDKIKQTEAWSGEGELRFDNMLRTLTLIS